MLASWSRFNSGNSAGTHHSVCHTLALSQLLLQYSGAIIIVVVVNIKKPKYIFLKSTQVLRKCGP